MTFADWLAETRMRFREMPPGQAARISSKKFWRGANRRTVDPLVGRTWWDRDWDVLVVLDACRVDLAREVVGDVGSKWSPASTSIDWIERHFAERHRDDWESAGYVTANPFADHDTPDALSADLKEQPLGYLDLVFEREFQEVGGIKTTPPEAVTDAAIHAWRHEDLDRLIVHYMQPHQPFRSRPEWETVFSNLENLAGGVNQGGPDIWKRCRDGEFSTEDVWEAYRDNLEWVLEDVETRLLENLDADHVVLTSDHGNGMGEWGSWSHSSGMMAPTVRKVPVWTATGVDEHSIEPEIDARQTDASTTKQLAALGYVNS